MKYLLRALLVVVSLATVTIAPVLAKTSWNANSVWPPKNLHSVGLSDFAEKVKKATNMVTVNLKTFQKLPKARQDTLVKIGKETEEAMWANVKAWDRKQEAISNKNGIETIKPSAKLIGELEKITESIRADWLKTAPEDGKQIYGEFIRKVKR